MNSHPGHGFRTFSWTMGILHIHLHLALTGEARILDQGVYDNRYTGEPRRKPDEEEVGNQSSK